MHYKPPKPLLQLKSVPRFSQVYWCDFSISNVLPEFDDVHPAIIIRSGQKLENPHIVVPVTTRDHEGDVYAHRLDINPNPKRQGDVSWVVRNHLCTVASERLKPMTDRYGNEKFPVIGAADMHQIGKLIRRALERIISASIELPKP